MKTFLRIDIHTIIGFVLGVVTVLSMLGPGFVFGTSPFWDYPPTDFNSHLIGYRAYVLDAWRFPLFQTGTLEDPQGLNLLFMDALPIVALPAKLLAPIVPSFARTLWFNPFGAWVALSYGLQGAYGARLMRELVGRSAVAEISGAAIAVATPVFVFRFLHIALASHFFILAALLLYLRCVRERLSLRDAALRWTGLFVALALVHPYLFAMCGGVFAATLVAIAVQGRSRQALVLGASAVVAVLLIVALAGFHGTAVSKGGMWGYGYKMTDLVSFFTPQWATFAPYAHVNRIDMTRDEASEGWSYLGAGVLVVTVIALATSSRAALASIRRHWVLAAMLAVMAAFAISHRVTLGSKLLFELPLPGFLEWPTRQFRSCGRFMWPAIYAGTFLVLALVFERSRATRFAFLTPLVAAIQFVDVLAALLYVRAYTSRGETRFLDWSAMAPVVADHKRVQFAPSFECVSWPYSIVAFAQMEVEFMAAQRGVALSSVRSSRPLRNCRREPTNEALTPVTPDQLYLIFPPRSHAVALHFEREGARCAELRNWLACSTRFAKAIPPGFRPFSANVDYTIGDQLALGNASSSRYLGTGWSWPEGTSRWTDGPTAFVYLRLAQPVPAGARIHLRAAGVPIEGKSEMSAAVRVNDALAGEVSLPREIQSFEVPLPVSVIGQRALEIQLQPAEPRSFPTDSRELGIAMVELAIVE